jgi:hypothetical protein
MRGKDVTTAAFDTGCMGMGSAAVADRKQSSVMARTGLRSAGPAAIGSYHVAAAAVAVSWQTARSEPRVLGLEVEQAL